MATILIVEDEVIEAMALREVLQAWGHRVLPIVTKGGEAVATVDREDPDLVLMDFFLADGTTGAALPAGDSVASGLRNRNRWRAAFAGGGARLPRIPAEAIHRPAAPRRDPRSRSPGSGVVCHTACELLISIPG